MVEHDQELASELEFLLRPEFDDIAVRIERSERWKRMCATFRSAAFEGLLPEERFQRLTAVLPSAIRTERMKGFVWLELAPDEAVDDVLKMPRSEDVADREGEVFGRLQEADFFGRLKTMLGKNPQASCQGGFGQAVEALSESKWPVDEITGAKLVFIRRGVFCDCQVLASALPALEKEY